MAHASSGSARRLCRTSLSAHRSVATLPFPRHDPTRIRWPDCQTVVLSAASTAPPHAALHGWLLNHRPVLQRNQSDVPLYNAAAADIMAEFDVPTIDLYSFVVRHCGGNPHYTACPVSRTCCYTGRTRLGLLSVAPESVALCSCKTLLRQIHVPRGTFVRIAVRVMPFRPTRARGHRGFRSRAMCTSSRLPTQRWRRSSTARSPTAPAAHTSCLEKDTSQPRLLLRMRCGGGGAAVVAFG